MGNKMDNIKEIQEFRQDKKLRTTEEIKEKRIEYIKKEKVRKKLGG